GYTTGIYAKFLDSENYKLENIVNLISKDNPKYDRQLFNLINQKVEHYNKNQKEQITEIQLDKYNHKAKKIQKCFGQLMLRKKGIDTSTPLYFSIKSLRRKTEVELSSGAFDQQVNDCIARAKYTRDREMLRWLAFSILGSRTWNHEVICLAYL